MVVTAPPSITVVPLALVVRLAPVKVPVIVVVPVLLSVSAAKAFVAPTLPVKVKAPEPRLAVKARAVALLLFKVEANVSALSVVVKVVSAPKVTASL